MPPRLPLSQNASPQGFRIMTDNPRFAPKGFWLSLLRAGIGCIGLISFGCTAASPPANSFTPPAPARIIHSPQIAFDDHKLIQRLAVSREDTWLAGLYRDHYLVIWRFSSGEIRHQIPLPHKGPRYQLDFHPTLPWLVARDGAGGYALVHPEEGTLKEKPEAAPTPGLGGFTPDGQALLGGIPGGVVLLDPATGKVTRKIPVPKGVVPDYLQSADGRRVVFLDGNHPSVGYVLTLADGRVIPIQGNPGEFADEIALSPDGTRGLIALRQTPRHRGPSRYLNTLGVADLATGALTRIQAHPPAVTNAGNPVAVDVIGGMFSPDGRWALGTAAPHYWAMAFRLPTWEEQGMDEAAYHKMRNTPALVRTIFSRDQRYLIGVANFQWPNPDVYKTVGVYDWQEMLDWHLEKMKQHPEPPPVTARDGLPPAAPQRR